MQVSILSERRVYHPYGLEGGEDAKCGLNVWVRRVGKSDVNADDVTANGKVEKEEDQWRYVNLGAKNTASMQPGERIIINTPGGGGWGKVGEESKAVRQKDPTEGWRKGSVATRLETAETSQ